MSLFLGRQTPRSVRVRAELVSWAGKPGCWLVLETEYRKELYLSMPLLCC